MHTSKRKKEGIKRDEEEEEEGGMIVQYRVYAEGGTYALSLVGRMNEWMNEWMNKWIVRMNGTARYALRSQGKRA